MDFSSPPPSRELRRLAPSAGVAASAASARRADLPGARARRQLVRDLVQGHSVSSSTSRSPSLVVVEGNEGFQLREEDLREESHEEVRVQIRRRLRRTINLHIHRTQQDDDMMAAAAWTKPLFMGQGLRKHLVESEALFILSTSRLGRVPQPGEHAFVVLDATKNVLALQSMSEPIRDRLLRAKQNATSDLRMKVQVGEADPAANPREMVGWAAATWPQCVIGLGTTVGRFYPDEIVPATVVAEASCLRQKWYSPFREGVTSFYNGCLATWPTSQKPEEFTELTMLTQFIRGLSPFLNPELGAPGTAQYLGEGHMGIRHKLEQDMEITTTPGMCTRGPGPGFQEALPGTGPGVPGRPGARELPGRGSLLEANPIRHRLSRPVQTPQYGSTS